MENEEFDWLNAYKNQLNQAQNLQNLNTQMGLQTVGGGVNQYGIARPGYAMLRDEFGNLDPRFTMTMGDTYQTMKERALDQSRDYSLGPAYEALRLQGMAQGDTEGARLARERQDVMRSADMDRMRAMQASGVTQGMRNLAMRGGVGTGARERLMRDATRQGLRGLQGIGRDNRLANLQISLADDAKKAGLLAQLGAAEQKQDLSTQAMKSNMLSQVANAEQAIQQANLQKLVDDVKFQNLAAQQTYKDDMAAWGAQQTAAAQESAADSGK